MGEGGLTVLRAYRLVGSFTGVPYRNVGPRQGLVGAAGLELAGARGTPGTPSQWRNLTEKA